MASGKEYKIAFKLAAELESSFGSILGKAETNFKDLEKQIKDIQPLRLSGEIVKNLSDDVKTLVTKMREVDAIRVGAQTMKPLKDDIKETRDELHRLGSTRLSGDITRALEANVTGLEHKLRSISSLRIGANVFEAMKRDIADVERQMRALQAMRITGEIVRPIRTDLETLERQLREIVRLRGPQGTFQQMKDDLKVVLPDLREMKRLLTEITRIRMPANQFGGDIERYVRQIRDLEAEMRRIQNMRGPSPPPGGGGGDPSGGGSSILAIGGPGLMAGAAVVGAGIGIGKVAEDYQRAMKQIQASTGVTADEMASMRDTAKAVYAGNFGEGWEDVALVMGKAKQVTGQMGTELQATTENALVLRTVFEDLDVESSLKTATTLAKQFGITTNEAYNLIGQGAQQGLDYSGELLDSANEYAVYFKTLGLSAEDMFNVFKSGKESGAFNLDKVGDAVKEFGIRVKDGSKSTNEAMAVLFAPDDIDDFIGALNLGGTKTKEFTQLAEKMGGAEPAKDLVAALQKGGTGAEKAYTSILNQMSAGGDILDGVATGALKGTDAMSQIIEKLMSMDDKTAQAQLGVALFGTQWEDMESTTIAALTNIGDSFDQTKDTMGEMAAIKYDTIGQAFRGIGRQLQTTFILPLVDAALPALSKFSNWFRSAVPAIKGFFSSLGGSSGFGKVKAFASDALENVKWLFENGFDGEMVGVAENYAKMLGMDPAAAAKIAEQAQTMFKGVQDAFAQFRAWIGPIMAQIGTVIWNTITSMASAFGKIISALAPIMAYISGIVGPIIAQVFGFIGTSVIPAFIAAWGVIGPKIGEVVGLIGPLMTAMFNAIKPTIDGIVSAFQFAWPFVQSIVMTAIDIISGVVGGLLDVLGGVITFVTGVFTGNWSTAWEGIKGIFSGVWEGIKAIAVGAINGVIRIINNGISKINGLSFDMPELLGGGHVGINVPTIPEIGGGGGGNAKGGRSPAGAGMQAFADGGFSNRPAIFGEGRSVEAAIPIDNRPRSHALLDQANRMMGHDTGGGQPVTIEYSPQIIIQGNADAAVVKQAQDDGYREFAQHMDRYFRQQRRTSFG